MCMAYNMADGFCSGCCRFFVNTAHEKSLGEGFYTVASLGPPSSPETVYSSTLSLCRATVTLASSPGRDCRTRLD